MLPRRFFKAAIVAIVIAMIFGAPSALAIAPALVLGALCALGALAAAN